MKPHIQPKEIIKSDKSVCWRVNTHSLLKEIIENGAINKSSLAIFKQPINIFMGILAEVGQRATEIHDKKLNALMCRLAIYETSDPYNAAYDKEITRSAINEEIGVDAAQLSAENEALKAANKELYEALKGILTDIENSQISSHIFETYPKAQEALNNNPLK